MREHVRGWKTIAIDDDPTGSQTVHSCPLLMRWDVETLKTALLDPSPILFVLTNSRSMEADEAARVNREVARNLRVALREAGDPPCILVSRSDSTLRGHFPAETDALAEELGPFDATFLVPAFFEAGRVTIQGIHYIRDENGLRRTDETPFAADSVFGYSTSYLPEYVQEKTGGAVPAAQVSVIPAGVARRELTNRVRELPLGTYCAVDAEEQRHLDAFAEVVRDLTLGGKRYLFRSAASLLTSLAQLPPQPLPRDRFGTLVKRSGVGVVVCGSHVPLSTQQLDALLSEPGTVGIEIDVDRIAAGDGSVARQGEVQVRRALDSGRAPVIFTSRTEWVPSTTAERLELGRRVSAGLVGIVQKLPDFVGFIIAKGGITSHDILNRGLDLKQARVFGQIAPGCTVVLPPAGHKHEGIPVVVFPGNVGTDGTLREVFRILTMQKG